MLSQQEAEALIKMDKHLVKRVIPFVPTAGGYATLELESFDGREQFLLDINRKGRISLTKCTYQNRYRKDIILIRLDIDGPEHENPDGTVIPCPHLHIYREGYDDKWAVSLPKDFSKPTDLTITLNDFFKYCNVNIKAVQGGIFQ